MSGERLNARWFSLSSRLFKPLVALAIFGLGLLVVGGIPAASAAAGINNEMNFQGRLLTAAGAVVPDGTYNGTALTKLAAQDGPTDAWHSDDEIWYLKNPAAATGNIVVSTSGAGDIGFGAYSIYNVDTTNPFPSQNSAFGQSKTAAVTLSGTNPNQLVLDVLGGIGDIWTANSAQTVQWNIHNYTDSSAGSTQTGGNGSTAFSWTVGATTDWEDIAVAINPLGGTTADSLSDRLHIDQQGDVGVDNANPQYSLDVAGTARVATTADTTTAFQVQNAAAAAVLTVDTTNERLYVGPPAGDTVGALLVLGNKSTSGDPPGVNGAMYYNVATRSFRCYENGAWLSCLGGLRYSQSDQGSQSTNAPPATDTVANTTTATTFSDKYTVPAGDCTAGRVYRVTAGGTWGTTGTPVLTIKLLWGATAIAVTPSGMTPGTSIPAASGWYAQFTVTCFTNYAGSLAAEVAGNIDFDATNNGGLTASINNVSAGQTITTTSSEALALQATWGTPSTSNTITLRTFTVEALGP